METNMASCRLPADMESHSSTFAWTLHVLLLTKMYTVNIFVREESAVTTFPELFICFN